MSNIEQLRNEWVARQMTVAVSYRDDNEFIGEDDETKVGEIVLIDGTEHLVDHNGEGEVVVPAEYRLGLVDPRETDHAYEGRGY